MIRTVSMACAAAALFFAMSSARADAVLDWNAIALEATAGTPPGLLVQSRTLAIVHLAIYDALNSITGDRETYAPPRRTAAGADERAAVVAAAHRALVTLHPGQAPLLDASLASALAAIPDGTAKNDGVRAGIAAADAILAMRARDGSSATVDYTPRSGPGAWVPTPPALLPPLAPHWRFVTPFGLASPEQFRPPPPPRLDSAAYAHDYEEVKRMGDRNSTARPPDRTTVAQFYAAPGAVFYNPAARQVSLARGHTLAQNALHFAWLAMGIADAFIACFDAKYHYDVWRPVTAIERGDADGNGHTRADAGFVPLIVTPNFASYPSGHACVGGAAREILEDAYGKGDVSVTLTSPVAPGVTLHYTSWKQITDDVDDARVFGGIHFRFDQVQGALLGRRVGRHVRQSTLKERKGR